MNSAKELIETLNQRDHEELTMAIIKQYGGDPGHDIGDSTNAMEMLSNIITERNHEEQLEYFGIIADITGITIGDMELCFNDLITKTSEQWTQLYNELYPQTPPYSGFGPAW